VQWGGQNGQHNVFWPMALAAAAVFAIVAGFLFSRGHADARVVTLFGFLIFVLTDILLVAFLMYHPPTVAGESGTWSFFQGSDAEVRGQAGAALALAVVTGVQVMVLIGSRSRPDVDPQSIPPPM
jgi:hypothetical protein